MAALRMAKTVGAFTVVLAPAVYIAYSAMQSRGIQKKVAFAEGISFPHLFDLVLGFAGSVIVVGVRVALMPPFEALGLRVLSAKNAALKDRVQRFGAVVFKTIFYFLMTAAGYALLRNEPWFPAELGGSGDPSLSIAGWPLHQLSEQLRMYFLVQLAYKAHELLYLVMSGLQRNDWFEMAVHHTCTLLLICLAWGLNWTRLGALVLFVHDAGDIFTYAIKVVVDTNWKVATGVMFFLVVLAWGWTRLYVFPAVIIRTIVTLGPDYVGYGSTYCFAALLGMLFLLHCYWFGLILQMGWKAVNTGKPEDTYQRHDE